MPWTSQDAKRHTHLANSPRLQRMWSDVANNALKTHGNDAWAIREANAVVHREHSKKHIGAKP